MHTDTELKCRSAGSRTVRCLTSSVAPALSPDPRSYLWSYRVSVEPLLEGFVANVVATTCGARSGARTHPCNTRATTKHTEIRTRLCHARAHTSLAPTHTHTHTHESKRKNIHFECIDDRRMYRGACCFCVCVCTRVRVRVRVRV